MLAKLTAVYPEQIRYRDKKQAEEAKDTGTPVNAQLGIHWVDEKWEGGGKDRSEQGVGSDCRGGVSLEGIDQIVQGAADEVSFVMSDVDPLALERTFERW